MGTKTLESSTMCSTTPEKAGAASKKQSQANSVGSHPWEAAEGSPSPLGATWLPSEQAYNFAIYSKYANRVELRLYQPTDLVTPVVTYDLNHFKNKTGRVLHARLPRNAMRNARYYAYSIDGPPVSGDRFERHAFDPEKILLDPYAKSVFFPPTFDRTAAIARGSNAGKAPLGMLCEDDPTFDWGDDPQPRHDADLVIYELHVRGFTMNANSGVSSPKRGTFSGIVEKIPYLQELGVTAVELMPVFQFDSTEPNYWGYDLLPKIRAEEYMNSGDCGEEGACRRGSIAKWR